MEYHSRVPIGWQDQTNSLWTRLTFFNNVHLSHLMPFTALVQRQFSLRNLAQANDAIAIGQIRGRTIVSNRKRRAGSINENCQRGREVGSGNRTPSVGRACPPAWVLHLDSFRHRSFCTTSTAAHSTSLLSPTTRPVTSQQLLYPPTFGSRAGVTIVQARQCKTSAQYISDIEELVQGNKAFKREILSHYPNFFEESAKGQSAYCPKFVSSSC